MADPDLLIVGGSVRAAAWCAVRAGLKVAALDRYNDLDLLAVAEPCFRWDGSDEQVERVVGELGVPWMYTGPLENRPDLVDRCAALAPLRGNSGDVLRAVRDPVRVQSVLREAGLPWLEVREEKDPPLADGRWVLKPRLGCGGRGVVVWSRKAANHPTLREPHYFQEFAGTGLSTSGSVAGNGRTSPVRATATFHAGYRVGKEFYQPFRQRFLRGPFQPRLGRSLDCRVFERLAEGFALRGPAGADVIYFDEPRSWESWASGGPCSVPTLRVTEVNPRFTASMELLPTGLLPFDTPAVRSSRDAALAGAGGRFRMKQVIYTRRAVQVGRLPVFAPHDEGWIADVPAPGSVLPAGSPVCTVFALEEPDDAEGPRFEELAEREATVRAALSPA